ncbi:MAG: hypothetical protein ACI8RD_010840, partial [Bacillariaceae sp.]
GSFSIFSKKYIYTFRLMKKDVYTLHECAF